MEMKFISCWHCGHICEYQTLKKNCVCHRCQGRKYFKVHLGWFKQILFLLQHPSYFKYLQWR